MRLLVVLAALLAAFQASATAATPATAPGVERRSTLEGDVVQEINLVRTAHDLRPLRTAPSLRAAARAHSSAMLELGFFGHESSDGAPFSDRIRRYYTNRGWQTWSVGEALLASQGRTTDAHAIVAAWLDSPPHREIILSPSWRDAGVGVFYAPQGTRAYAGADVVVVTADFGLRTGKSP